MKTTAAAGDMCGYYYQQKKEALNIVAKHMQQNDIDDYTVFCYFAPCTCTEMHYLTGTLCAKCEEINGDNNAIQKQLVANAIGRSCVSTLKNENIINGSTTNRS